MDEDDDPTRPSLEGLTGAGHAFALPWRRATVALLTGFDSSKIRDWGGPWKLPTPFETSKLRMSVVIPDTKGGTATYREAMSSQYGSQSEHISASLGLTIGYPFLNANVTAEYDLDVVKKTSMVRASRNASCRLGRVIVEEIPKFSEEALDLLLSEAGAKKFQQLYGDFYVYGYELGADAGATLSANTKSEFKKESLKITVSVKVLFAKASKTFTKETETFDASASMSFAGYSTLTNQKETIDAESLPEWMQKNLIRATELFLDQVSSLDGDARRTLKRLKLRHHQKLPLSACSDICETGLVVQLLLAPYARLGQFVTAVYPREQRSSSKDLRKLMRDVR